MMEKQEGYNAAVFADRIPKSLQENAVDCVILGYDEGELKVLLLKWKYEDIWSLPGGYIKITEDLDAAAYRVLQERTGLTSIFLEQFKTFGAALRQTKKYPVDYAKISRILDKIPLKNKECNLKWITKRFLTTGYFALVNLEAANPTPGFLSERCEWVSINAVPQLLMDHNVILKTALEYLKKQLNYLPIGKSLLPEKFTMQDLQKLYEVIIDQPLVRSNFQRKILKLGILDRQEKLMTGASNKAPYLYSFNTEKYDEVVKKGIGFSF